MDVSLMGLGLRPAVKGGFVPRGCWVGVLLRKALRRARSWASKRVWDTGAGC